MNGTGKIEIVEFPIHSFEDDFLKRHAEIPASVKRLKARS